MINFPDSPTTGQQFTAAGATWTYDGVKWNFTSTAARLTASDTPPSNPKPNDLWFDSTHANLFVFYNDGNSSQWVVAINAAGMITGQYMTLTQGAPIIATAGSFMSVNLSANQAGSGGGAPVNVLFDTVEFDTNGEWVPASYYFKAKRAGYYRATAKLHVSATATSVNIAANLLKNGSLYAYGQTVGIFITGVAYGTVLNKIVHLAVNDTLMVQQTCDAPASTIYFTSQFEVQLLALG